MNLNLLAVFVNKRYNYCNSYDIISLKKICKIIDLLVEMLLKKNKISCDKQELAF